MIRVTTTKRRITDGITDPVAIRYAMIAVTPDITAFAGRIIEKKPAALIRYQISRRWDNKLHEKND